MDGVHITIQQARAVKLAKQGGNSTGAVHVLDVVGRRVRGHLAQARDSARNRIDIVQGEINPGLVSDRKNVKNGVGGAAHGNVQAHRVLESVLGSDRARQNRIVIIVVVRAAHINDAVSSFQEELLALDLRGQSRAVSGQCQADSLVQAVHGVRGEHARAGSTGRASVGLNLGKLGVRNRIVHSHDHCVDQVETMLHNAFNRGTRLHRATGDEDRRDIQAHGSDEHTGSDLVAVRDTHQGVRAVSVDHVLHRVRNHLARRQRVEHAVVTHSNAIINGDGIEFLRDAARLADCAGDKLAHVLEVDVAGNELGERVRDRDDRLAEISVPHAGRAPERTCSGHVAALS